MMGKGIFTIKDCKARVQFILICLLISMGLPTQLYAQGECPQTRKTPTAPKQFLVMKNPLPLNAETLKAGEALFQKQALPITCKTCHGVKGNGKGEPDFESTPAARNFTCVKTMETLTDGQLFWIIRNGSPNTSMFGFPDLSDKQVWQLVHYIRQFAKK